MNNQDTTASKISELEERIHYLENINRQSLDALEQAASLGDFQTSINKLHSHSAILEETRPRLRSLIPFEADAFLLVNESNSEFYVEDCQPESYHPLIQKETENLIENGTFAWAIREQRPIFVPTLDQEKKLLVHVLTTSSRVRGMFVGMLPHGEMDVTLVSLSLTSVILHYSANALESFELYSMIKTINQNLEQTVAERTQKLQYQLKFENLVASLLKSFIEIPPGDTFNVIGKTLCSLAKFTHAEKYFVFFLEENQDLVDCIKQLAAPPSPEIKQEYTTVAGNNFAYILEQITGLESLYIPDINQLPRSAVQEAAFLKNLGTKSALIVPMVSGGSMAGFFGFGFKGNESDWSADIRGLLKIVGEIFVIALNRVKTKKALQNSREQLRHAQKMDALGRLAGGVAHDFNNILTAITIASEIALQYPDTSGKVEQKLHEILRASERAADLTRQLLAVSRKQIIKPKILDVGRVIWELNKMLRRLIPEDIEILVNISKNLQPIKADPGQIEQILINLAVNARDAIKENTLRQQTKQIVISISHQTMGGKEVTANVIPSEGEYISISVADTGVGMSKEVSSRIFEPFFTTKQEGKGTGLGLATVYGIVKQNNGGITINSAQGMGATFTVFWPCAAPEEILEADIKAPTFKGGGDETILLVEDDDDIRSAVKELLEGQGYTILEAENGQRALEILDDYDGRVQLLITDIMMPIMDGRELAETLHRQLPDIKIIFTTGYNDTPLNIGESLPPNSRFIQKPYSVNDINKLSRELLDTAEPAG